MTLGSRLWLKSISLPVDGVAQLVSPNPAQARRGSWIIKVLVQVCRPMGMYIPGQHHRILPPGLQPSRNHSLTSRHVAIPGICRHSFGRTSTGVTLGKEDLLAQQVPRCHG
jgi:hypothetical protein